MTLIMAATCKNGICICSDTRYTEKTANSQTFKDGYKKVYRLKQYPIVIYNHGINRFKGIYWNVICNDFENLNTQYHSFDDFCSAFINYAHPRVESELKNNTFDDNTFFVICGRIDKKEEWQIAEFKWNKSNFIKPTAKKRAGLIRSGTGTKCVDAMIMGSSRAKTSYWKNLSVGDASKKLQSIFEAAIPKRTGDEFSDTYNIELLNQ